MEDEMDLLEALVRVPSPSGSEDRLGRVLLDLVPQYGYRAEVDAVGNVLATRGTGRPGVMYLGHMDTVPGELPVVRTPDRLQGRGSVDAKGCLAAALVAGARIEGTGGTLRVVAAVGEETDSRGARFLLRSPPPDFLVVGEPGGWDAVTVGYHGLVRLRYTAGVPAAHASAPWSSSGDRAVDFVGGLRRAVQELGLGPTVRPKVTGLRTTQLGPKEVASVDVEIRVPLGIDVGALVDAIRLLRPRGVLEVLDAIPPVEVDRGNAVVRTLNATIRRLGGNPTARRKAGTSDMNLAARAWGIPMATYGPGNSHLDHGPDEAMDLPDLRRATAVLTSTFRQLLRPVGSP